MVRNIAFTFLLALSVLLPTGLCASKRQWTDARFTGIANEVRNGGAVAMPYGSGLAAVPVRITFTYYRFETDDMVYVFATRNKKPLNLTLHGKAQIAYDGDHGYVIDDAGKEQKLLFSSKTAKAAK